MRKLESGSKMNFVRKGAENVVNSIRVAPQWHVPGAFFGGVTVYSAHKTVENLSEGKIVNSVVTGLITLGSFAATAISEGAVLVYHESYEKMKSSMLSHGWDERIVEKHVSYYCGNRAARIASYDAGYTQEFEAYKQRLAGI